MLILLSTATGLFKESDGVSGSYIGYVFLVLIGLLIAYVAILLVLKKLNIIKSYGAKNSKNTVEIVQRAKLNQNITLIHYKYLNQEYLIIDNGRNVLDLSHTLKEKE